MYWMQFDDRARVLHQRLEGFWSLDTFASYNALFLAQLESLCASRRAFGIFSDTGDYPVQSAAIAQAFGAMYAATPAMAATPNAIVAGTMLNKLQVERLFTGGATRVFMDRDEALAWVTDRVARPEITRAA